MEKRKFVIYSKTASTSHNNKDLKKAGRWDILIHSLISALYNSNNVRENVEVYLVLMGPPNPCKTIKIYFDKDNTISKKNVLKLIQMSLKKAQKIKEKDLETELEIHPGVYVSNKKIENLIENDFKNDEIFILNSCENHIKNQKFDLKKNQVFILGDYDGFDKNVKKIMRKLKIQKLSLGNEIYFTSQSILIINYELDNL